MNIRQTNHPSLLIIKILIYPLSTKRVIQPRQLFNLINDYETAAATRQGKVARL